MSVHALFTLALLLSSPVLQTGHQAEPPERAELRLRIETIARQAVEKDGVPGLSIAAGQDSELWIASGWGYADAARGEPATCDTTYSIGTLTRQFTVVGILQLVDAGKVRLDDDLSKLVPGFQGPAQKITLEQLLAGTSGIASWSKLARKQAAEALPGGSQEELLALLQKIPLDFAPGEGYAADSADGLLLEIILSRTSGQPFENCIREHLVEPLGLEHTVFCHGEGGASRVARDCRHIPVEADAVLSAATAWGSAAHTLCSSATDLFHWQCALDGRALLGEESSRRMTGPTLLKNGDSTHAGFATSLGRLEHFKVIGHTGGIGGFSVRVAHYPEAGATIVVLANCGTAPVEKMEQEIARALLGLLPSEVVDLPLEAREIARCVGTYMIATTRVRIFEKDGKLEYEEPAQPAFALLHQGHGVFVSAADRQMRITFKSTGDGPADSFEILRGGLVSTGKRIE
jgi:D-alanyl-D-alanine carboxypeptidase